jgi:hypothetical protein
MSVKAVDASPSITSITLLLASDITNDEIITFFPRINICIKCIRHMLDVAIPSYRYVHFDFHHVCRGGNFDNLQALYSQIEEAIQKQGYFLMNSKGEILLEQSGVVRSNCIDCLDRTNVTQVCSILLVFSFEK